MKSYNPLFIGLYPISFSADVASDFYKLKSVGGLYFFLNTFIDSK